MPEQMEHSGTITYNSMNPISIKVARGQRGGYGWEIEVKGNDTNAMLTTIHSVDQQLRETYRQEGSE